jgi:hypothetical protein
LATSVIKKPTRDNNHPIGENSPNLVTLFRTYEFVFALIAHEQLSISRCIYVRRMTNGSKAGLPDFSWRNIPKRKSYTKNDQKYTQNDQKYTQINKKYTY